MRIDIRLGLVACLCLTMLAGCNHDLPVTEILPRNQLIARHNTRAEAIGMIRAKCHIEARIAKLDEQGKPIDGKVDTYSLDGNLLLRKPRDLYLVGKAFSDPQFGLHSNAEMYWWWVKPGESVEYRGRYDGPAAKRLPIRPDYLIRGLGIHRLPDDMWLFLRGREDDILQTLDVDLVSLVASGRIRVSPYVVQEIRLERVNHLPQEVRLYDSLGEPLVVTRLGKYKEVDGQMVPTEIEYHFVPVDWTFKLSLKDISLTREIKDVVFQYRPKNFERSIDLDAEALRRNPQPAPTK
jgi:hypothetical protein